MRQHTCSAVLFAVALCGSAAAAAAQTTEYGVSAGISIRAADRGALGGNTAMHLRLHTTRWWSASRTVGSSIAVGFDFFGGSSGVHPSCDPQSLALCVGHRGLSSIASMAADVVGRPRSGSWLAFSAGPGLYFAATDLAGAKSDGHRQFTGLGIGVGVDVAPSRLPITAGFRTRYFPTGLGEIRQLSTATVALRF